MPRIGVGQWDFNTDDIVAVRHTLGEDSKSADYNQTVIHVYLKSGHVLKLTGSETQMLLRHFGGRWAPDRLKSVAKGPAAAHPEEGNPG